MRYEFDWVDAFTDRPFSGNGCLVVHGAADLSLAQKLALVRETNLAECAFLTPSDVADFGVRYYLADKEIPMAGHPTVATVVSLIRRGLVDMRDGRARFNLEVGAGVMPIDVIDSANGPLVTMAQAAPVFGRSFDAAEIAPLYHLDPADIIGRPQVVSTGPPFPIVLLRDKAALRRAQLDLERLSAFRTRTGSTRADFMEPFLVTLGGQTDRGDTFCRLLMTPPSLPEDPFTGSATGCMAVYLWHYGLIGNNRFTAAQGHWLDRPGRASVEVIGPPQAIESVRVGGVGTVLMRGELLL